MKDYVANPAHNRWQYTDIVLGIPRTISHTGNPKVGGSMQWRQPECSVFLVSICMF
jgi:hypothetical protein